MTGQNSSWSHIFFVNCCCQSLTLLSYASRAGTLFRGQLWRSLLAGLRWFQLAIQHHMRNEISFSLTSTTAATISSYGRQSDSLLASCPLRASNMISSDNSLAPDSTVLRWRVFRTSYCQTKKRLALVLTLGYCFYRRNHLYPQRLIKNREYLGRPDKTNDEPT